MILPLYVLFQTYIKWHADRSKRPEVDMTSPPKLRTHPYPESRSEIVFCFQVFGRFRFLFLNRNKKTQLKVGVLSARRVWTSTMYFEVRWRMQNTSLKYKLFSWRTEYTFLEYNLNSLQLLPNSSARTEKIYQVISDRTNGPHIKSWPALSDPSWNSNNTTQITHFDYPAKRVNKTCLNPLSSFRGY